MTLPLSGKFKLPNLDTGPLPLSEIREEARRQLVEIVDSRRGKKVLIIDPAVSGPISLIDAGLTDLFAEHGVARILHLENLRLDDLKYNAAEPKVIDIKNVIYIVRATVENARLIASQIKQSPRSQDHDFCVFFAPRRTIACDRLLEEEGVYGDVTVGEFPLDLLPFDDDVLSLESEGSFRDCVVDGDITSLFYVARSLLRLQAIFGTIPRIQGKGPAATAVRDMCVRMRREAAPGLLPPTGRIDHAILLDREVDLVTPMLTQITFEGLLDEITGIRQGGVPWQPRDKRSAADAAGGGGSSSASSAGSGGSTSRASITLLNSTDPFYKELRDLPFPVAATRLQQHAKEARREYSDLASKDLSQLKMFVKGLPKLALLDRMSDVAAPVAEAVRSPLFHRRIRRELDMIEGSEAEDISFIEELIYRGADVVEVLRLLVLHVTLNGGIQKRALDALRSEIVATYGPQHLLTLHALEKSGLIRLAVPGKKSSFPLVKKAFGLLAEDKDLGPAGEKPPGAAADAGHGDIYSLYNGYAPLSIRLVQTALSPGGWASQLEAMQNLPGSQFDILQTTDANGASTEKSFKHLSTPGPSASASKGGSSSAWASSSGTPGAVASRSSEGLGKRGQQTQIVLVVFIGGVTYAEISALRLLSSQPDYPYSFLVLTTKIVSGKTLIQSFIDPLVPKFASCVGLK